MSRVSDNRDLFSGWALPASSIAIDMLMSDWEKCVEVFSTLTLEDKFKIGVPIMPCAVWP